MAAADVLRLGKYFVDGNSPFSHERDWAASEKSLLVTTGHHQSTRKEELRDWVFYFCLGSNKS